MPPRTKDVSRTDGRSWSPVSAIGTLAVALLSLLALVALSRAGSGGPPYLTDAALASSSRVAEASGSGAALASPFGSTQTPTVVLSKIVFYASGDIWTMNADGSGQTRLTTDSGQDVLPHWSKDRTKIVFYSDRAGNDEIYSMNADGTSETRLTTNGANDHNPCWSPDGAKIVFHSNRDGNNEVYVMNAGGSGPTRLTNNGAADQEGCWSPDGGKIVFVSGRDGNLEVYTMNADGSGQTRLTNTSAEERMPEWSPDGSKIAFFSQRDGNPEIYVMKSDGSAQTRVTNHSASDSEPAWSPDGTKIVFQSDRDGGGIFVMNADGTSVTKIGSGAFPHWGGRVVVNGWIAFNRTPGAPAQYAVYLMNPDGSNQTAITTAGNEDVVPSFSPDAKQILFRSKRDGNEEIYVMNADGTGQTRLTNNSAADSDPSWSPDSTKVVFYRGGILHTMQADGSGVTSLGFPCGYPSWSPDGTLIACSTNGREAIYTMRPDGSLAAQRIDGAGEDFFPVWSPNGNKFAFVSSRDGNREIYIADAPDGLNQKRLTNNPAGDESPVWSPDGSKILFHSDRTGNGDVYMMNPDGTGVTQLTSSDDIESPTSWGIGVKLDTAPTPTPTLIPGVSGPSLAIMIGLLLVAFLWAICHRRPEVRRLP